MYADEIETGDTMHMRLLDVATERATNIVGTAVVRTLVRDADLTRAVVVFADGQVTEAALADVRLADPELASHRTHLVVAVDADTWWLVMGLTRPGQRPSDE